MYFELIFEIISQFLSLKEYTLPWMEYFKIRIPNSKPLNKTPVFCPAYLACYTPDALKYAMNVSLSCIYPGKILILLLVHLLPF